MATLQKLILTTCLIGLVGMATSSEESNPVSDEPAKVIKLDPASTRRSTGGTVEIKCTSTLNTTLQWQDHNNQVVGHNTSSRVHVTAETTLVLQKVEVNDTGSYTCITTDGLHNATTPVVIFVMPTYFLEGMIILIVNAVLILVFFLCLVHALLKNRRQNVKHEKAMQKQAL